MCIIWLVYTYRTMEVKVVYLWINIWLNSYNDVILAGIKRNRYLNSCSDWIFVIFCVSFNSCYVWFVYHTYVCIFVPMYSYSYRYSVRIKISKRKLIFQIYYYYFKTTHTDEIKMSKITPTYYFRIYTYLFCQSRRSNLRFSNVYVR